MENGDMEFWESKLKYVKQCQEDGIDVHLIRDRSGTVYAMHALSYKEKYRRSFWKARMNSSPALVILEDGSEVPTNYLLDWGKGDYPKELEQPIEVAEVVKQRRYWEHTFKCTMCGKDARNTRRPSGTFEQRTIEHICLPCNLAFQELGRVMVDEGEQPNIEKMPGYLYLTQDNILWRERERGEPLGTHLQIWK